MNNNQRGSLSMERRIILVFIVSTLAGILLVGGSLWFFLQRAALAQNRTYLESQASMLARQCESEIADARQDLEFIAKMPAFKRLSSVDQIDLAINGVPENVEIEKRQLLAQRMDKSEQFSVLFILRPNGDIYLEQPFKTQLSLKKYNLADRLYFQEAVRTKQTAMSDSLLGAGGMTGVAILVPILAESGEVTSYLGAFFYLSNLSQLVSKEQIRPFDAGFIVDRKGQLIAHTDTTLLREGVRKHFIDQRPLLSRFLASANSKVGSERQAIQGDEIVDPMDAKRYLRVLVPLSSGWGLGLMRNRATVLAEVRPVIWGITSMAGLLLALIGSLGVEFAHGIGRRWDIAECALRVSEAKFRDLAESMPQLIWTCTGDGHCDYISTQWVEYTGIPETEQLGFGWLSQLHPDDCDRTVAAWNAAVEANKPFDIEFRIRRKDGIYRWFKTRAVSVRDSEGRIVKWYGTNTDVEDQKRAEEALRASEQRFRIASETSNDLVYEWDLKQNVQWFGKIDELLGYVPGEFPRTLDGWAASLHPEDLERVTAAIQAHLKEKVPYDSEYRVRSKDGDYRWWAARGATARTPEGTPVRWVGTVTDITERKQAEEVLRESEARYRTLVENIPQKIFMKDRNYRYVTVNENFARDLGVRSEEFVGKVDYEYFPKELADKYRVDDKRVMETGQTEELEERYVQYGKETWVHTFKTPVWDNHGEIIGVFGIFWDITDRKRAEEEIRTLNAELEQRVHDRTAQLEAANKELEAFSYSVSHDLRAPLRHVQGYVNMLAREAEGQLSDKSRHYMKTIEDASREMGVLIDDLLAFSRMGRAEMCETSVDLDKLVQETLRDLEPATRDRNINWNIPPLPVVQADPAMLKLALVNLLGNAVKFTRPRDPAQIEIGSAGMEGERVVVFVRDNGVGFDPQYTHKLFGVFQRLHRADEFEGTGIGLANVRRIIARHGGRTWAEGKLNEGATFFFTLKPSSVTNPTI